MREKVISLLLLIIALPVFGQVISNIDEQKIIKMRNFEIEQNMEYFRTFDELKGRYLDDIIDTFMTNEMGGRITSPLYYLKTINDLIFKSREKRQTLWESKLNIYFSSTKYYRYIQGEISDYIESIKTQRISLIEDIDIKNYKETEYRISIDPIIITSDDFISEQVMIRSEKSALSDAIIDSVDIILPLIMSVVAFILWGKTIVDKFKAKNRCFIKSIGFIAGLILLIVAVVLGNINRNKMIKPINKYYTDFYQITDTYIEESIEENINKFYEELLISVKEVTNGQ